MSYLENLNEADLMVINLLPDKLRKTILSGTMTREAVDKIMSHAVFMINKMVEDKQRKEQEREEQEKKEREKKEKEEREEKERMEQKMQEEQKKRKQRAEQETSPVFVYWLN
jgi:hypothetical protein